RNLTGVQCALPILIKKAARECQHYQPPGNKLTPTDPPPQTPLFLHMNAMQILAPPGFCPLTNRQPYQRDRAEVRRAGENVACIVIILAISEVERKTARRQLERFG